MRLKEEVRCINCHSTQTYIRIRDGRNERVCRQCGWISKVKTKRQHGNI